MIYATFPFLLTPLCKITAGLLTSLIFTLHTLHSIEGVGVGGGGGSPLGAWHSSVAGQRLLRVRLRRRSKQEGLTYSATMGSRDVPYRGLQELMVAFSLFTQVGRDWGKQLEM